MPRATRIPSINRNEAAQLSGASAAVVRKAIEQGVIAGKRAAKIPQINPRDVAALRLFGDLHFGLPVKDKKRVAKWLREAQAGAELALSVAIIVRNTEALVEAAREAVRYAELRERLMEVNPDRMGGEPVIRGTRIPIRGLAKQIEAGETREVLLEEYDYIAPEAFDFAVQWARANPRRGRPARARREPRQEPAGRRAYIEERRRRHEQEAAPA